MAIFIHESHINIKVIVKRITSFNNDICAIIGKFYPSAFAIRVDECDGIPKTVGIRADGVVLLAVGLRGPSGGEWVVHPRPKVEERDGGGEEGLDLLAGEVPSVGGGGGGCDRLSDRCRNPLAERVVVAGLDDGAGVAVDNGSDAAEVVAEVDEGL